MTAPLQRAAVLQRLLNTPGPKRPIALPGRTTFAAVLARVTLQPKPVPAPIRRPAPPPETPPVDTGAIPYQSLIQAAAYKHGVDPALLAAVAKTESSFNPRAQSGAGAKGLMQLMDATAARLGVTDSFDPAQSIEGGARFLGGLLKQFNGDVRLALAAYNAGPGAVKKFGGIPPYQETQRYVPKVLAEVEAYRRIWANNF